MVNKNTDFIASLAKGLRVLEVFSASHPRCSVADVARETDLDRATARRCLLTLHSLGYADYDGKFFQLTPRVLRLGVGVLASMPLPKIVQSWLDQLSDRVGYSASVSILDETEIVYIARAAQQRVMSIGLMPGSRLPAHSTSMGRALLAALPGDRARALIERSDLTPRTVHSLTDPSQIMAVLEEVRTQGFAVVDQEIELGLRSIAVPIFNSRRQVVAALNIGAPAIHDKASDLSEQFLAELLRVQSGLEKVIG